MIAVIKKIRFKIVKYTKKRQFINNSIFGDETIFDNTSGCQNASKNKRKIQIGKKCMIRGLITTCGNGSVFIGDNTYIGGGVRIGSVHSIYIGSDVIIGGDTHIYDNNNHPTEPEKRLVMTRSGDYFGSLWCWNEAESKEIMIEDNVWIGERCAILKGVKIGKGAIVGCNSVVTHNVPEYSIVAGNPAKVVKFLTH